MKLLEFITYCSIKGWVQKHEKLAKIPSDDEDSEYFAVAIDNRVTETKIEYKIYKDTALLTGARLYTRSPNFGWMILPVSTVKDIVQAFIN